MSPPPIPPRPDRPPDRADTPTPRERQRTQPRDWQRQPPSPSPSGGSLDLLARPSSPMRGSLPPLSRQRASRGRPRGETRRVVLDLRASRRLELDAEGHRLLPPAGYSTEPPLGSSRRRQSQAGPQEPQLGGPMGGEPVGGARPGGSSPSNLPRSGGESSWNEIPLHPPSIAEYTTTQPATPKPPRAVPLSLVWHGKTKLPSAADIGRALRSLSAASSRSATPTPFDRARTPTPSLGPAVSDEGATAAPMASMRSTPPALRDNTPNLEEPMALSTWSPLSRDMTSRASPNLQTPDTGTLADPAIMPVSPRPATPFPADAPGLTGLGLKLSEEVDQQNVHCSRPPASFLTQPTKSSTSPPKVSVDMYPEYAVDIDFCEATAPTPDLEGLPGETNVSGTPSQMVGRWLNTSSTDKEVDLHPRVADIALVKKFERRYQELCLRYHQPLLFSGRNETVATVESWLEDDCGSIFSELDISPDDQLTRITAVRQVLGPALKKASYGWHDVSQSDWISFCKDLIHHVTLQASPKSAAWHALQSAANSEPPKERSPGTLRGMIQQWMQEAEHDSDQDAEPDPVELSPSAALRQDHLVRIADFIEVYNTANPSIDGDGPGDQAIFDFLEVLDEEIRRPIVEAMFARTWPRHRRGHLPWTLYEVIEAAEEYLAIPGDEKTENTAGSSKPLQHLFWHRKFNRGLKYVAAEDYNAHHAFLCTKRGDLQTYLVHSLEYAEEHHNTSLYDREFLACRSLLVEHIARRGRPFCREVRRLRRLLERFDREDRRQAQGISIKDQARVDDTVRRIMEAAASLCERTEDRVALFDSEIAHDQMLGSKDKAASSTILGIDFRAKFASLWYIQRQGKDRDRQSQHFRSTL